MKRFTHKKRYAYKAVAVITSLLLPVCLSAYLSACGSVSGRFALSPDVMQLAQPPDETQPAQPELSPGETQPAQPEQSPGETQPAQPEPSPEEVEAGQTEQPPDEADFAETEPTPSTPAGATGNAGAASPTPPSPPSQPPSPPSTPAPTPAPVAVEAIALGFSEMALNRGDMLILRPGFSPGNATIRSIRYTSDNESVATVSADGTVRAVGPGTAVIRCVIDGVSAAATITVSVPVTGINVTANQSAYQVGDQGAFAIQIHPADATDRLLTINVSGEAIRLTDTTAFTCDTNGEAVITVTAANGVSGRLSINVVDLVALADEVFRLTNIERENAGLEPFVRTSALTQVAAVRAGELIRHYSHNRPDGRDCYSAYSDYNVSFLGAGENIAMGQRTPEEVVRAWMNSTGHRENILRAGFGRLGVGAAMDDRGRMHWSQNFAD